MAVQINTLKSGDVLTNDDLQEVFGCGNSGGMRRAKKTNSLILICDHTKALYDDRWENGILFYTGMGMKGNQQLSYMQNKTLAESKTNGVELYLFEVFSKNKYLFQGRPELADNPFKEEQLDEELKPRKVWIFPLQLKEGTPILQEKEVQEILRFKSLSKANKVITKETLKRIVESKEAKKTSKGVKKIQNSYYRDANVVLYALRRANGVCDLCEKPAPFESKDGLPFLEVHHIEYLSQGGADSYDNVSALCPNCHRKVHALEEKKDVALLKIKAQIKLA